jgi:amidase
MRPTLLFLFLACLFAGCERSAPVPVETTTNLPRLRELDFSPFAAPLDEIGSRRLSQIDRILTSTDVSGMQEALAKGELTSEELTLAFLDRIRRHDGHLRSYLEINPHALTPAEWSRRLKADDAFIQRVSKEPKLWLKGDAHELGSLG